MGCSGSKATNVANTDEQVDNNNPTIYVNAASPVARAVVMIAPHLGVKVTTKEIDLLSGEQNAEWFLKINPNHSVPVLVHGDTTICESLDIAKYLAKTFDKEGTLYPDNDTRTKIDEMLVFAHGEMYPNGVKIAVPALQGTEVSEEAVATAKSHCIHLNDILANHDYVSGDCITIADMFVFSMLANVMLDPTFVKPEGLDNLNNWKNRIRALPYFASTHKAYFGIKQMIAARGNEANPTIYMNYASPVSRSVMMTAAELGIKVNVKHLDLLKGEHKTEEYLKINPNGTVPAMVHGETTLYQSRDIARYLVNTFSKGNALYPEDEGIRSKIDELLKFDEDVFCILGKLIAPLFSGKGPAGEDVHAEMHAKMLHISPMLSETSFLTGEAVTIVDFFIFNNFLQVQLDPTFSYPSGTESLHAWAERMKEMATVDAHYKPFIAIKNAMAEKMKES